MAKAKSVKISPAELKRAQDMWANFTEIMKWTIVACVVSLALLGIAFVDWTS